MNLKRIDDSQLILSTEKLAREERELLTRILRHLEEIQRRRLFSSLGYKSLFDFAVRKLGYSEDQAYRRISAMRLLVQLPEIEEKMNEGSLSLSHISLAQNFFKQEEKFSKKPFSNSEKIEIFDQIAKKPIREAERITLSFSSSPAQHRQDRVRAVSQDLIEMKLQAPTRLEGKIEKLKGFLAHKYPGISSGELFDKLCDLGIEEYDPASTSKGRIQKKISKNRVLNAKPISDCGASAWAKLNTDTEANLNAPTTYDSSIWGHNITHSGSNFLADVGNETGAEANTDTDTSVDVSANTKSIKGRDTTGIAKMKSTRNAMQPATSKKHCDITSIQSQNLRKTTRAIPKRPSESVRRMLFKVANGRCQNCQSTYALEIDHHQPQALGGSSEVSNLRVLCRSCNHRSAIRAFGQTHMDSYLNK